MSDVTVLLTQILARLSAIEDKMDISGDAISGDSAGEEVPKSVKAFDKYLEEKLVPFCDAAAKLGGDALTAGSIVKEAWHECRAFLLMASACKEPAQAELPVLLAGLGSKLKAMSGAVSRNEWEKHTKTCSEGIACLNWVCIKPAPVDFIESSIGGSDYYANAIRKEFRTTNPDQIAFCDTFKALIIGLMAYVKEFHTTGVTWNAKGGACKDYKAASPGAPVSAAAAPAAQQAASTGAAGVKAADSGAKKADLFSALNKGGAITGGLKTVTKDMQTWRSEYKGGDVPPPVKAAPKAPAVKTPAALKGPPVCEFNAGNSKWSVEYQAGPVSIDISDKKETVYIFGCVGATINIQGKCKSIIIDNCKKTHVSFDAAMASFEVVNCQRVNVTCREMVPAVAIDKTDGIVVFLPATSLTTEIVASKSSEMNLQWNDDQGELVERPIPEQYVHRINGLSITANVSDLYGH